MKKNLIYGAALAALTTLNTSESEAQTKPKQPNRVLSRCPEYSATGEGILLKNYIFNHLGTDNLSRVFSCLYSERGGLRYDTTDAKKGLESMITRLRVGAQTPEKRASIRYLQDLKGKVSENTSLIFARSPSNPTYAGQSLAFLAESGKKRVSSSVVGDSSTAKDSTVRDSTVTDSSRTALDSLAQIQDSIRVTAQRDSAYQANLDKVKAKEDSIKIATNDSIARAREDGRDIRLTADVFYPVNKEMNLKGGALGLRYGIFGAALNVTSAPDTTTQDLSVDLSNGRRGIGKEKETGYLSLGGALEVHSPFKWLPIFVGGGMNYGMYSVEKEERIVSAGGNDLRPPVVNSRSESETSQRYYGGIELRAKKIGVRAFYGEDTKKGKFAGAGLSFRLNRKQDRR